MLFRSVRATVHSRANAATSAVSAASFCFFFEDRRLNGRIDAVRASCIAWLSEDGGMTSYSVQEVAPSLARARIHRFSTGGSGCLWRRRCQHDGSNIVAAEL